MNCPREAHFTKSHEITPYKGMFTGILFDDMGIIL